MDAKEALFRWAKNKNTERELFLNKWLEGYCVDAWARYLHIYDAEVTLDQYGVLVIIKGRVPVFDRDSFVRHEKFCIVHLHLNMNGVFRCVGTTEIDGVKFSNLPKGTVNDTQLIFGKRKLSQTEGKKILAQLKNHNMIYYSRAVKWSMRHERYWALGEEWHDIEVGARDFKKT